MGLGYLSVVWRKDGALWWKRGNALPDVLKVVTRRKVFSFCGRFVRHLSIMWVVASTNRRHQVKSKRGNEKLGRSNKRRP